ncbi:MAG TPA: MFS transporter [Candidatus Saccharimonadales bacterium]|jgi:MFS family permease|nr:MFS transporter [Candidatus Saccharimonadales bacterium]
MPILSSNVRKTENYKWVALANTTLGVIMATIDSSIILIALPDVFRGIKLNPLLPGNSFYLLWMILSFLVVSSVLVVSFGRLGDMFGRVKMYTLGFFIYTLSSILLTITWMHGTDAAVYLIVMRVFQGVGAAFILANSTAILTDAFPSNQRGLALGINNVAAISGSFIGLILGGLLGPIDWRLIFLVSVPFGIVGTLWSYYMLYDTKDTKSGGKVDWLGNITFAIGLVLVMVGITYGIEPHGSHIMGWSSPAVLTELISGAALLIAFLFVERKVTHPMFQLHLFKIRAFTAGVLSSFLSAIARGGLMFMLIIWLQGIWLPLHGYSFSRTPLWAGILMLPLTAGFLIAGPISGILTDKLGSRPFATAGMIGSAISFVLLSLLPINFNYILFALILLLMGLSMGAFAAPNRVGVMNSLPAKDRGAGGGMNSTFQNSAQVLSIGIFFSLMIAGLASSSLSTKLFAGLTKFGVPASTAASVAHLPPVSVLFAAFLGYNPIQTLVKPNVLDKLSSQNRAVLTGHGFFPSLISQPFLSGLREAFAFAIIACLIAAAASWLRGKKYVHGE